MIDASLKEKKRKSISMPLWLSPAEKQQLDELSEFFGGTRAETIRVAVRIMAIRTMKKKPGRPR